MNKKVTVIIVAFNEEKYLENCLDTIEMQDYRPIEIIVVDDGSTDQTTKIIKKHQKTKAYYLDHQGTALARNFAAEKASGEILVFVDADMKFETDFIANLVKPINIGSAKGTFSKLEYVANWDQPLARCWNRNNNPPLPDRLRVPQNEKHGDDFRAILKTEFEKVGGFDNIGYTDTWTLAKKLGYKSIIAPKATYYHYNPADYPEIFQSARWIGKRIYKMDKIGSIITIIRSFILCSFIRGVSKAIKYAEWQFVPFQVIYDFGLTAGALDKIFYNRVIK